MFLRHDTFSRLCHARQMLAATADEPITVAEIAVAAGMSPFHFIRLFESIFGLTPHQYRISERLNHAKRLLAAGNHSVTDVCMEIGFSSVGSFSDLFSKRVGMPPSQYRSRNRAFIAVPGAPKPIVPGCLSLMACLPGSAFRNFGEASRSGL